MPRIIVVGGRGFFGAVTADALRREGLPVFVAARRPPADLRVDAEDAASMRAALAPGDIAIDAAGPFQQRSTTLVETCLSVWCDLIDIADSLADGPSRNFR